MYRFLLRDAAWLTADRVGAICRVLLLTWAILLATSPWTAPSLQVGRDFAAFWTAAGLAMAGKAAEAYGPAAQAAMAALFGADTYPPFFYPPNALFLWLPVALAPFAIAAGLWVAATALAYGAAMRAVLGGKAVIPALAFPAVWICAMFGQNALLSAALFGGAAAALERYPVLAGGLIGCLGYKPQLAMLAPLAFAAARRWRAFWGAAIVAAGIAAASVAAFGTASWAAFIAVLPQAQDWNGGGRPGFGKFASPYAALRLLGASPSVAWIVHGAVALAAIATLIAVARRRPGGAAEMAMLVAATMLCVPFLGQYDLAIAAVAGGWVAVDASRRGWLGHERAVLAMLYISPPVIMVEGALGMPLAPLALAALACLVARRAWAGPAMPAVRPGPADISLR